MRTTFGFSLGLPFSQLGFIISPSEKEAADQYIKYNGEKRGLLLLLLVLSLSQKGEREETRWSEREQAGRRMRRVAAPLGGDVGGSYLV